MFKLNRGKDNLIIERINLEYFFINEIVLKSFNLASPTLDGGKVDVCFDNDLT